MKSRYFCKAGRVRPLRPVIGHIQVGDSPECVGNDVDATVLGKVFSNCGSKETT